MRDTVWLNRPPYPVGGYRAWLTDSGSLTSRIQARCPAFGVKVAFQGRRRVNRDEQFLVSGRRYGLVREVFLMCRRTPVVFAHSIIDPRDLRGAWRRLTRLGARPLGAALFADPRIRRYPLRQRKVTPGHELYRRACLVLKQPPPYLWARRSLFTLRGSPILVTEVFLPEVLRL